MANPGKDAKYEEIKQVSPTADVAQADEKETATETNEKNTKTAKASETDKDTGAKKNKRHAPCPGCGFVIEYDERKKDIICPSCGVRRYTSDLTAGTGWRNTPAPSVSQNSDAHSYAIAIDSPDSALVYVENFFREYNWDSYKLISVIEIPEIREVVEKNKIKYGATDKAWILDFESRILPLTKKLEGLAEQEQFFLSYNEVADKASFMDEYDLYENITNAIKDNIEVIFDKLLADIEYAEKFGADEETIASMKQRFNDAVVLYNDTVHEFDSIEEIPSAREALEAAKVAASEKLARQGIDAEKTYEKAVRLYNSSEDKQHALRLFEAIKDYGDSSKYVKKINEMFIFDNKIIKLANKHFLFKLVDEPTFRCDTCDKRSEVSEHQIPRRTKEVSYSLYEIIDGVAYEPAAVTGISCALAFYGNKLFYIKRNKSIESYDVLTHEKTELDIGMIDDYPVIRDFSDIYDTDDDDQDDFDRSKNIKHRCLISLDNKYIFLKKKLSPFKGERKGCIKAFFSFIASIFKKKKRPFTDNKNNYEIIRIDMVNNVASTVIDRVVDIAECFDDHMFYIAYQAPVIKKTRTLNCFPSFMLCNLKTGEKKEILGDDCHIHNVIGDNVIYTTWDPNKYNQMLFTYNIKTDVTTLVEANVYKYVVTIGDRLYYSVGNRSHNVLFSNDIDGTDRVEIMRNVNDIFGVYNGWIYLIRGLGSNRILFKISSDGNETCFVCSNVAEIIKITDTHTYYVDFDDTLHSVRNDGNNDRALADDIYRPDKTIIDKNSIYYLRYEAVKDHRKSGSLYRMDLKGNNVKKLIFNVDSIEGYDENSIYVYKGDTVKYIATATLNGKTLGVKYPKFSVSDFSIFDKNTETETHLLSVGRPNDQSFVEKKGCFRKKKCYAVNYTEISNKIPYRKKGLKRVGEVYAEQTAIDIE